MARLKHLEVVGFRAFGAARQTLDFEKDLAVIYAPNSHGKTSLAEAIEFLLTGTTSRRMLVGSAVREFADALRNAHLPSIGEVMVRATIEVDGKCHLVERKLVTDYTARGECTSTLTIDGKPSTDVTSLGIRLALPPLAAPVLMPHGLTYVLRVEPVQRTTYFKMLLEMSDLDEVRRHIAGLGVEVSSSSRGILARHADCANNDVFGEPLRTVRIDGVRAALSEALNLAAGSPSDLPADLDGRIAHLRTLMADRQGTAFPIAALKPGAAVSWTRPIETAFDDVLVYRRLLGTINAELARVQALYATLLEIPQYRDLRPSATTTCPICRTSEAITGDRISEIRAELEASVAVTTARAKATTALRAVQDQVAAAVHGVTAVKPPVFGWTAAERGRRGFSTDAMTALLGEGAKECVEEWRHAANRLQSKLKEAEAALQPQTATIAALRVDTLDSDAAERAFVALTAINEIIESVGVAQQNYSAAYTAVRDGIEPAVARRTNTEGWKALLALAAAPESLQRALCEAEAVKATQSDLDGALKQIDDAIAEVLDAKYEQLSGDVSKWWRLMRPDTTTRFSGLQRAGTGRRFLDMKAGLFEAEAKTEPTVIRDAVAVFSESQLNCLGLAAFLARAVRQRCGFIVLDDPFPSSDADHRTMFLDEVVPELRAAGIQLVLLTHDDAAAKDAYEMHADAGVDYFAIGLTNPVDGAAVTRTKDDLDVLLHRASALKQSWAASAEARRLTAKHLREAAERFCKLLFIKNERATKGTAPLLSELSLTLERLVPMVEPLLTKHRGDPGKLRVIPGRMNPGNHDDSVPGQSDLGQTLGNLTSFKDRYLDAPPRAHGVVTAAVSNEVEAKSPA